jgi:hypothetical protein
VTDEMASADAGQRLQAQCNSRSQPMFKGGDSIMSILV